MDSTAEHKSYLSVVLDVLTKGVPLHRLRASLSQVARLSSDNQLKLYIAPVRRLLASIALESMDKSEKMALPLDRPPYSALIAYCRRGIAR
jgi:hypothetical protein